MRSPVHDAAAAASSAGPGTTTEMTGAVIGYFSSSCRPSVLWRRRSLQRGGQRPLKEDVVAGEGQLDAEQLLGRPRLQAHGSLGKLLVTEPDLRGKASASKPGHAEASRPLIAAGVDQEAMDAMLECIIGSKFQRYLQAHRRQPAADPPTQQPRLGGRPVTAMNDRDA